MLQSLGRQVFRKPSLASLRCFAAQPVIAEVGTSSGINPAAVLYGPKDLRWEEHPLAAEIPEGHVRVAIRATGICGSDVHFLHKGRIGDFVVKAPMVLGHESAGDVVGVGPGTKRLIPGERVALEPGVPCWGSTASRHGRYNLDPDIQFFATPPVHGTLQRYVDHPEEFCFKLSDTISYEEGAMIEPLSNGIHACRRAGVQPGKTVAILGAGPMGLNALVSALAFGASKVAITDVRTANLPLAERLGAKYVLQTPSEMTPGDAAALLKRLFPPEGPDIVIDCAGYQSTVQTGVKALARGGRGILVGMGQESCSFPIMELTVKELDYGGCFRYTNTYPLAIQLLEEGRIDVKPMISHRFPYSAQGVAAGFACAASPQETNAVKVMFEYPVIQLDA